MSTLTEEEKRILLDLACSAVEAAAKNQPPPQPHLDQLPPRLREPGASFVTLTQDGMLRGCIGTIKPQLPLAQDVVMRAVAAAREDPRFPPLRPEELPYTSVEVSVLTPPEPLRYETPEEIPSLLRPGIDGVILARGLHRGTFLPQVWEKLPDPHQFLDMLCQKAYLPPGAWKQGDVEVFTYQVESFHREPGERPAPA